jgi:hypothetical protein
MFNREGRALGNLAPPQLESPPEGDTDRPIRKAVAEVNVATGPSRPRQRTVSVRVLNLATPQ